LAEIVKNNSKYLICGGYRHPGSNILEFTNVISALLHDNKNRRKCILTGDFNVDISKYSCDKYTTQFVDEIVGFNFCPMTFLPTRVSSSSSTTLDQMYCNLHNYTNLHTKAGVMITDNSDHFSNFMFVITSTNMRNNSINRPFVRKYNIKAIEKFRLALGSVSWNEALNQLDANVAYNEFHTIFNNHFNNALPLQKCSKKQSKSKPWITSGIKRCIIHKRKLYKKWKQTELASDEYIYKKYKKILQKQLKEFKKIFIRNCWMLKLIQLNGFDVY